MKIIQISDIHIPHKHEETHGIDIRNNFERVISHASKQVHDAIVITGDLAYKKGSDEIYSYIKKQLQIFTKPVYIIPGNHDLKHSMKNVLSDFFPSARYFYEQEIEGQKIIFLNTGKGTIDKAQLAWLRNILQHHKDCIIFMHHPPIDCDVLYMDMNHALKNQEDILDILYSHPYTVHVYCGHYHVAKQIISKNVYVTICPSAYYQIHETSRRFAVGSIDFGYRMLDFSNQKYNSEIIWV